MDINELRQRSASHSSLRSTYSAHGRPVNYANSRPPPQRRPLRSVNDNVALLRSPGPLESMLKITTETGDIGVFSIKASPSPMPYLPPARSRPHQGDAGLLPMPRYRGYEDNYFQDDHKRLRSYRDTTSEIISLYGSDGQQTLLTSVSPSSLDDGPRSYSMTTTSSKRIPSLKSSGTLQSQSSGSGLQRPRSPFPYPTRLKRPGVRPASPALAENGDVDYSRMIELDRFSQRTVHGSYKPTYAHGSRRPPPLSFRGDVNKSTTSLPSRTSPSRYHHGSGSCRARTPNSFITWTSGPSDRHRSSSTDQSIRSASLTSIVEMYNRPVTYNPGCPPLRSAGSFYYDYSEEFENLPPRDIDMNVPICPIPQRAGSIRQPMVLMNDSQISLDVAEDELGSENSNSPDSEKGQQLDSTYGAYPDICQLDGKASLLGVDDDLLLAQSTTPTEEVDFDNAKDIPSNSTFHQEEDNRSTLQISPSQELERPTFEMPPAAEKTAHARLASTCAAWLSKPLKHESDAADSPRSRRFSQSSLSILRCSLDPAMSDVASVASSFDRLGKSRFSKMGRDMRSASEECYETSRYEEGDYTGLQKRLNRQSSLPLFNDVDLKGKTYRKRHRRNIAAVRISTTITPKVYTQETHESKEELLILSPKPISPMRQLRVKDSIPQLMKTLPPLPGEGEKIFNQDNAGVVLSLDDMQSSALQFGEEGSERGKNRLNIKSRLSRAEVPQVSQESPPKFKTRAKASPCLGEADNSAYPASYDEPDHNAIQEQESSPAARLKFKLKVSRSQLGQTRTAHTRQTLHSSRMKHCNSLAKLVPCPRRNETANTCNLDGGVEAQQTKSCSGDGSSRTGKEDKSLLESAPHLFDQLSIPYPPSPDQIDALLRPDESATKVTLSKAQNVNFDDDTYRRRGLRGKFSVLRLQFVGKKTAGALRKGRLAPLAVTHEFATPLATASSKTHVSRNLAANPNGRASSTQSDKTKWCVKKWAHDAKRVVRSYFRRKLDQSSRASD